MQNQNEHTLKGKWKEIKGEIQKKWGQLTDSDLDQTKGDLSAIGGLIQQKYGHAKEEVKAKLDSLIHAFSDNKKGETHYSRSPSTQGSDSEMRHSEDEGDIMNRKLNEAEENKDYH